MVTNMTLPGFSVKYLLTVYISFKNISAGWGRGQEGEVTQTMYAHVNK
jgi:hypothetical protein